MCYQRESNSFVQWIGLNAMLSLKSRPVRKEGRTTVCIGSPRVEGRYSVREGPLEPGEGQESFVDEQGHPCYVDAHGHLCSDVTRTLYLDSEGMPLVHGCVSRLRGGRHFLIPGVEDYESYSDYDSD